MHKICNSTYLPFPLWAAPIETLLRTGEVTVRSMTDDGDARGSACCCCTTGFTAAMGLVPGVRLVLGPDTWYVGGAVAVLAEADTDLNAEDRKLVMDCCCCPGFFDLLPLPLFNIFNTDSFYIVNLFCKENTLIIASSSHSSCLTYYHFRSHMRSVVIPPTLNKCLALGSVCFEFYFIIFLPRCLLRLLKWEGNSGRRAGGSRAGG